MSGSISHVHCRYASPRSSPGFRSLMETQTYTTWAPGVQHNPLRAAQPPDLRLRRELACALPGFSCRAPNVVVAQFARHAVCSAPKTWWRLRKCAAAKPPGQRRSQAFESARLQPSSYRSEMSSARGWTNARV
ncbi:hypothetical protein IEO21_10246 [Rhodonia placenta]|uniref:Uncharacterized protein n=1 Tax=Rhodonia placenta TaxID=104341 RepID=A0A8H7NSX4_9APHY|nr:hypothetical protein IEO21_10246 [Postia placenta]